MLMGVGFSVSQCVPAGLDSLLWSGFFVKCSFGNHNADYYSIFVFFFTIDFRLCSFKVVIKCPKKVTHFERLDTQILVLQFYCFKTCFYAIIINKASNVEAIRQLRDIQFNCVTIKIAVLKIGNSPQIIYKFNFDYRS
jgi:hypothetical protein